MPTQSEVYEGTWEALSAHASKFRGRKLRLTILCDASSPAPSPNDRRAFLKLPPSERRRFLVDQAERMRALRAGPQPARVAPGRYR